MPDQSSASAGELDKGVDISDIFHQTNILIPAYVQIGNHVADLYIYLEAASLVKPELTGSALRVPTYDMILGAMLRVDLR